MTDINKTRKLIEEDEGKRYRLYDDKTGVEFTGQAVLGKLTIGIGYNIQDRGIPESIVAALFDITFKEAVEICQGTFPKWREISDDRQTVLISLAFNLGAGRFAGFKDLIAAVNRQDWPAAAAELLDSKAARDLPKRYGRLHKILRGEGDV